MKEGKRYTEREEEDWWKLDGKIRRARALLDYLEEYDKTYQNHV